jgi:hypothetical protein
MGNVCPIRFTPTSAGVGDDGVIVASLLRVSPWRVSFGVVCDFSCVGVGGRRGSGPGWWMCVEAAVSGFMVGRCFMRRSSCLHGLGDCLVLVVRRCCWLGRCCLRGGGLAFRWGAAPDVGVAAMVYEQFALCSLAESGWVVRRCGSSSSGGTMGWRSRKVVLVVCQVL